MIIGHVLLWFSLIVTLAAMLAYLPGVRKEGGNPRFTWARRAVWASCLGLLATTGYLWYLILTHQFQVSYVFRYSSLDMPFRYVVASLWGGQEGTFLLWAAYGGILAVFLRYKARQYEAPVNFFFMGITLFLLLMLVKRSPFATFDTVPADGNGLNPLLQDPWMTIHPPIMFMGFASLGVPAAFAMAALVKEDWDNWVPRAIPWTLFGVLALGTGLTLGGYWSYSILGWGGYWGWDPVENSSLVPWLFAVALLHSQMIQMRRGLFRRANLLLSMLPFLLLTYSTFLTRSGVLADFSVHSFTDLGINQFLAAFMVVFLGGGLALYFWKLRRIPVQANAAPFLSREYFMFLGALSFGLFGLFVCLGTSAPLISRLWGTPSNIEPEFYNRIGLPFTLLIAVLMGVAPHLVWNRANLGLAARKIVFPAAVALLSLPLIYWGGIRFWPYLLMLGGGIFVVVSNSMVATSIIRRRPAAAGGYVAHVGIGFMILGILTSTAYDRQRVLELPKDHDVEALGYTMRYIGSRPVEEGRKDAYDIVVSDGDESHLMSPTMYYSEFNAGMMKKPAILSFATHDVYVAPGGLAVERLEDRVKSFLVLNKKVPQAAMDMVFTFKGFGVEENMDQHTGSGDITAEMEVTTPDGVTHPMTLGVRVAEDDMMEIVPEPIPGTDYALTLDGVDATNGRVRLGIGAPPVRIHQGEEAVISGFTVRFHRFEVDMGSGRGNKLAVYAETQVDMGGDRLFLKPGIINRANMDPEYVEAAIGDTGLQLILADVEAANHTALFYVAPAPAISLWVEASTKPFIVLLWIGTALVVGGVLLAAIFRGRLAGRMAARLGWDDRSSKQEAA
jgi:cytochrome c-type biogenesis protein CcmF